MPGIIDGVATVWRKVGAHWERNVLLPARVEGSVAKGFTSSVQPASGKDKSSLVRIFTAQGPGLVAPGDYVVGFHSLDPVPPAVALRVQRAEDLTLFGRYHHTEAEAG